jgi:hypothetical protein
MKKTLLIAIAILVGVGFYLGSAPTGAEAKTTFVTIGTGGITGVYYPTGGAIARIVNKNAKNTAFAVQSNLRAARYLT